MTYAILYFPEIAYDRSGFELFNERVIPGPGRPLISRPTAYFPVPRSS